MEFQSTDRRVKRVFTSVEEDSNQNDGGPAKKRNISFNGVRVEGVYGFRTDGSTNVTPSQQAQPNGADNSFECNQLQHQTSTNVVGTSPSQNASHQLFHQQCQPIPSGISYNVQIGIMQHHQVSLCDIDQQEVMFYNPTLNEQQNPYYYDSNKILFELYTARLRRANH